MPELGILVFMASAGLAVSLVNVRPRFLAGRTRLTHLLIALLLGGGAAGGLLSFSTPLYYRLARVGVPVDGVVTAKEPDNHGLVRYRYSASGLEHAGSGNAGYGNPDFDGLKVGDRIRVVYLPEHPEISSPGDPHDRLMNEVQAWGVAGLLITAVAYSGLRRKTAPKRVRINVWRVIGVTFLGMGVAEGVGFAVASRQFAGDHPIWAAFCMGLTLAFLGFGVYAIRMARRRDSSAGS